MAIDAKKRRASPTNGHQDAVWSIAASEGLLDRFDGVGEHVPEQEQQHADRRGVEEDGQPGPGSTQPADWHTDQDGAAGDKTQHHSGP